MSDEFDWIGDRTQRRNEQELKRAEEKRLLRARRKVQKEQAIKNLNEKVAKISELPPVAKIGELKPPKLRPNIKLPQWKPFVQNIKEQILTYPWKSVLKNKSDQISYLMAQTRGAATYHWQKLHLYYPLGMIAWPTIKTILDLLAFVGILAGLGAAFALLDRGMNQENLYALIFAACSALWIICTRYNLSVSVKRKYKRPHKKSKLHDSDIWEPNTTDPI